MKAGVILESWKKPIYERHLKADGFTYEEGTIGGNSVLLKVTCDSAEHLAPTIKRAQAECREQGAPK